MSHFCHQHSPNFDMKELDAWLEKEKRKAEVQIPKGPWPRPRCLKQIPSRLK